MFVESAANCNGMDVTGVAPLLEYICVSVVDNYFRYKTIQYNTKNDHTDCLFSN